MRERSSLEEAHGEEMGRLMGAAATQEWKSHVDAMLMGRPVAAARTSFIIISSSY